MTTLSSLEILLIWAAWVITFCYVLSRIGVDGAVGKKRRPKSKGHLLLVPKFHLVTHLLRQFHCRPRSAIHG